MRSSRILLLVAFYLLLLSPPANAQETNNQLIPPNTINPTEVGLDLYINDILEIDEKMQTYDVDGFLSAEWNDPRQSFDPIEFGYEWKIYRGEMIETIIENEIWWPDLYLVDSKGRRETTAAMLYIDPNGTIRYEEKFKATIKQGFSLENFPFDSHILTVTISSYSYTDYEVVFSSYKEATMFEWMTNEWIVTDSGELYFDSFSGYPAITYSLGIKRLPSFYVSKYILPLALIVTISSIVFWLGFDSINMADRVEIIITSLLTVVAFDFVSNESLPKLSYLTSLDMVLILSYLILTLTMIETLIAQLLNKRQMLEKSLRLDMISRIVFPLLYYACIIIIIVFSASQGM